MNASQNCNVQHTYFDNHQEHMKTSKVSSESNLDNDDKHSFRNSQSISIKENKKYLEKINKIKAVLSKHDLNLKQLKLLAATEGGLLQDELRKKAWPQLLGISCDDIPKLNDKESSLQNHPDYQQVVLDVNRSLMRFPSGMKRKQRLVLQNQLNYLILKVVAEHPELKYYQGYHDIAVTLLLVTGLDTAYSILEKLSMTHLRTFLEPTMEKTSELLNFIYPLIRLQNSELYDYLDKSGVGTMFALPWFLTWFSHNLNQYEDVVRLFDYFLATEPLSPLYLIAVIVAFRAKEILNTPCDVANLHFLLSQIPENLPFDKLLAKASELYVQHPPASIQTEVCMRTKQEEEKRKREYLSLLLRRNKNLPFLWRMLAKLDPQRKLPIWALGRYNYFPLNFSKYKLMVATAAFAFCLHAMYSMNGNFGKTNLLPKL